MKYLVIGLIAVLSGCYNHRLILTYEQGEAATGSRTEVSSQPATEKTDEKNFLRFSSATQ